MSWSRAALALVLLIIPAVAACGGPQEVAGNAPRWESCRQDREAGAADAGDLTPLGDDLTAVSAVICGADNEKRPDGSTWLIGTEDRSDAVTALVAALRLPGEPRSYLPCTADNPQVPWFALLDEEGHWVRPGVPRDACGKQRREVRAAVGALTRTRVATWPIEQLVTVEAAAAGCAQRWDADVVARHAQGDSWAPRVSRLFNAGSSVRVCVYRGPSADFAYGGRLTAAQGRVIDKSVRAAPRGDRKCAEPAGRFAVLHPSGGGEAVHVELDGCRRVSVAPVNALPSLQRVTPAVLAMLTAEALR
jgi:hypothetical protein